MSYCGPKGREPISTTAQITMNTPSETATTSGPLIIPFPPSPPVRLGAFDPILA